MLYTSLALPMFALPDLELQQACFRVFNDWMAEYCGYNRKRLIGIAAISTDDVGEAIRELERCAKMGLAGAQVSGAPPEDKPYSHPMYEPFWQAASDMQIPISLHVISGRRNLPKAGEEPKPLPTENDRNQLPVPDHRGSAHFRRADCRRRVGALSQAAPGLGGKRHRLAAALHVPARPRAGTSSARSAPMRRCR